MRAKYSKIDFFKTAQVDKLEMIKVFAHTLGIDKIEIKIQKMREKQSDMDEMEALGQIIRHKLGIRPLQAKTIKYKKKEENDPKDCKEYETKIVSENDVVPYVDGGWDLVKELKDARIVIRRKMT